MAEHLEQDTMSEETPADKAPLDESAFPIVGIGASAGGLEAAIRLFEQISSDAGLAFVFVQHLDPDHASMLSVLLGRISALPVYEAVDGMTVASNTIYVIPPNTDLTISKGVLRVQRSEDRRGQHLRIDSFLRALAEDQQERAIGVILSGTGSDGTMGLRAIKAAGGITFAQDLDSAKYDGMPHSAIVAGVVDLVLPPEDIARELMRLRSYPALGAAPLSLADHTPPEGGNNLNKIFFLLRRAHKVDFSYYKQATIRRRIKRRMILQRIEKLEDYVRFLQISSSELDALYQDLLIDVTSFFRDPDAFAALSQVVFPQILQNNGADSPIRIWVPACATGEEVYSIAICLQEFFDERRIARTFQIFATDVNEVALAKARIGVYPETIADFISPEHLRRYFTRAENGYRISKLIRDMCIFARQDLTCDPPFLRLDLISCRNLLIYLNSSLQKRLMPLFHFALKPNSFLFLGVSETIGSASDLFSLVDRKYKVYLRKPTALRFQFDFPHDVRLTERIGTVRRGNNLAWSGIDQQREIDRVLLNRYVPAAVVIDDSLHIVQFRGSTGQYLDPLPGEASLSLLRMTRNDLMLDLRTLINTARRDKTPVRKEGIHHRMHDQLRTTNIEVIPVHFSGSSEQHFVVAFEDASTQTLASSAAIVVDTTDTVFQDQSEAQIRALQQELAATREYLQSIIEEHETTNEELLAAYEEIQSSNEELQSTNEELETAKEELQSINEEITTVNEEMQNRNLELSQINNDLTNLLSVVNIPIVMVSSDLRIRRFTPRAERILSLIPSDVGRLISDLRPKIEAPDIDRVIMDVITTLTPHEVEVHDHEGRWYSMRVQPYRTTENRIEGAVMILVDITDLKQATLEAQASYSYAEAIVEAMHEPVLVLDKDFWVRMANLAFCALFQVRPSEIVQRPFAAIGNGQWDIAELHEQLVATFAHDAPLQDFTVERSFLHIGQRTMRLNARKIVRKDLQPFILLTIEDMSIPPPHAGEREVDAP